jgi:hypothetical protein
MKPLVRTSSKSAVRVPGEARFSGIPEQSCSTCLDRTASVLHPSQLGTGSTHSRTRQADSRHPSAVAVTAAAERSVTHADVNLESGTFGTVRARFDVRSFVDVRLDVPHSMVRATRSP